MLKDKDIIEELEEQLNNHIVWIQYGDELKYPYTNCSIEAIEHVHVDHETGEDGCIAAYNLFTKQTEQLRLTDIYEFDYESNPEHAIIKYKRQQLEIESSCNHCPHIDPKLITEYRVNESLKTYDEATWCALTLLDFRVTDLSTIKDVQIDDDWREWYMNKIRKYRESSFAELDQLEREAKENGSSAEDLEDIETIKQMFRDIPQDCDLTSYKTIVELLEFWPSLLLPRPFLGASEANTYVAIRKIKHMMTYVDGVWTPEQELSHILQEINSVSDLESVLGEIDNITGTDIVVPSYAADLIRYRIEELSK